jgi:hypothetical protein
MSDAKPTTSVHFAPTPAFVRAFGASEARKQQQQFEKPSWAKGNPLLPEKIDNEDIQSTLLIGGAIVVAVILVGVCIYKWHY